MLLGAMKESDHLGPRVIRCMNGTSDNPINKKAIPITGLPSGKRGEWGHPPETCHL